MTNSSLFRIGVLAMLAFSSYNIAIIAGNTSATTRTLAEQAEFVIDGLQALSPLAAVGMHTEPGQHLANSIVAAAGRADNAKKEATKQYKR